MQESITEYQPFNLNGEYGKVGVSTCVFDAEPVYF